MGWVGWVGWEVEELQLRVLLKYLQKNDMLYAFDLLSAPSRFGVH